MESAFSYNCIATGFNFLSRKREVNQLTSLLSKGSDVVIYEPPRTGKSSLVEAAMTAMGKAASEITVVKMDFINVNSMEVLTRKAIEAFKDIIDEPETYLNDIDYGLSLMKAVSAKISGASATSRLLIYIDEFQNIMKAECWEEILHLYEKEWSGCKNISFLLCGSGVNAMKHIFEERKFLYNLYDRVELSPLEEKSVIDHIKKTFLRVGRVMEYRHGERIYEVVDGHPWYIWQIANTCFNLTKGYLVDGIIEFAIDSVLSMHEVRFKEMVDGLSYYQIQLLKAIFDGRSKVNSTSVIEEYGLNSSANVHRLKEALTKKEVIVFNRQGNPEIIDPMFRLWLERNYYI